MDVGAGQMTGPDKLADDVTRLIGIVALVRPDLLRRVPMDRLRHEAAEVLLEVRHGNTGDKPAVSE
jgi:hypothetical protein